MNKIIKPLILAVFMTVVAGFASTALAYNPTLTATIQNGSSNVQISVNGANPYGQINLYTRQSSSLWTVVNNIGQTDQNGNFNQSISLPSDGSNSPLQLYITVSGQQSSTVQVYYNGYNGGGCTYNCGNTGGLTLSQINLNLNVGQSSSITASYSAYNSSNIYVSSNSNSSVASASVSGNTLTVYGNISGSTSILVCASSSSSSCATLYVTVNGNNGCTYSCGTLGLSQTSLSLSAGQSSTVSVYSTASGNAPYISSNSNSAVASASVSGNSVFITAGYSSGSTTISICQSGNSQCASLFVTVSGGNGIGNLSLSQTSLSLTAGQTSSVTIYGNGSYYISSNSNSSVASAYVSGSTVNVSAIASGSTTFSVCQSSGSCVSLYVTVGNNGSCTYNCGTGSITFSQNNVNVNIGQNAQVTIYGNSSYGSTFYVQNNSNPSAVTVNYLSGNIISLTGSSVGSATINICQNSGGQCGSLYVTSGGYGGCSFNCGAGSGGSLIFQNTTLPQFVVGQNYNYQLQVTGGVSPYNFRLASGQLPNGVYLSPNGLLSGTPSYITSYATFTVAVNDSNGATTAATFPVNGNGTGSGGVLGASTYANGTLLSENGTIYIVYKNTQSGFSNAAAFTGFGFSFSNVMQVSNPGLSSSGYTITTSNTSHPWGSWIKNGSTVYFVDQNGLIPVPDWNTFLNNGGQANLIVNANYYDLRLSMESPMVSNDSRLH